MQAKLLAYSESLLLGKPAPRVAHKRSPMNIFNFQTKLEKEGTVMMSSRESHQTVKHQCLTDPIIITFNELYAVAFRAKPWWQLRSTGTFPFASLSSKARPAFAGHHLHRCKSNVAARTSAHGFALSILWRRVLLVLCFAIEVVYVVYDPFPEFAALKDWNIWKIMHGKHPRHKTSQFQFRIVMPSRCHTAAHSVVSLLYWVSNVRQDVSPHASVACNFCVIFWKTAIPIEVQLVTWVPWKHAWSNDYCT